MWLQDTGILQKLRDDELRAPNPKQLPKVKVNEPLSISQLVTVFLLAAVGIVISISAFFVELQLKGQKENAKPGRVYWGIPIRHLNQRKVRRDTAHGQDIILPETRGPPGGIIQR